MDNKTLIERARTICCVIPELELAEGETSNRLRLQSADEDIDLIDWQSMLDPEDDDRTENEGRAFVEMRVLLPALAAALEQLEDRAEKLAAENARLVNEGAEARELRDLAIKTAEKRTAEQLAAEDALRIMTMIRDARVQDLADGDERERLQRLEIERLRTQLGQTANEFWNGDK